MFPLFGSFRRSFSSREMRILYTVLSECSGLGAHPIPASNVQLQIEFRAFCLPVHLRL